MRAAVLSMMFLVVAAGRSGASSDPVAQPSPQPGSSAASPGQTHQPAFPPAQHGAVPPFGMPSHPPQGQDRPLESTMPRPAVEEPGLSHPATVPEIDAALKDIETGFAAESGKLRGELETRRKALVESPVYKDLSRSEQRARVRALKAEFKEEMGRLRGDYDARREILKWQRRMIRSSQ